VACELFAQWQRARGSRTEPAKQAFSRSWEELLEDARLLTSTERGDAERDARELEQGGWVALKSVRYKAHLLERISIPPAAEDRWCEAFGFIRTGESEARRIRDFAWTSELAFLSEARTNVPFDDLRKLHDFLASNHAALDIVPIKERSLEIFGDEKRLDILHGSALFRFDRLDLVRDLRCEIVGVPLAWKRGPASAANSPIIVIENAATWHSYARWNFETAQFSAVVYGDGNRFADGVRYLADIFEELGTPRKILYFGDLDPQGLLIPQEATARAIALGFPPIEPHLPSYAALLNLGENCWQPWEGEQPSATLFEWLLQHAASAEQVIRSGKRIAQEHIGWNFLKTAGPLFEQSPAL
jgi:hypothetical protein